LIRINKYLSICGVTSRRGADALITQKRVVINDKVVEKLGTIIDEENDVVKVDGTIVTPASEKLCILLYKPKRVMTTLHDPFKRKTVANFIKNVPERVYPIGRLDYDTEGLILMTNDGDLAYRLSHPKFQVKKIYEAGEILREKALMEERNFVPPSPAEITNITTDTFSKTSLFDLMSAFKDVLEARIEDAFHNVDTEEVTIEDRITTVMKYLRENEIATFQELFQDIPRRMIAIVTFIAILELVRTQRISVNLSDSERGI